jgi:hypothetical protein
VTSPDCDQFQGLAGELALGTLTGRARAAALGHLDRCVDCRRQFDDLLSAADMLLFLAPETNPPAGLAGRVFAHLESASQPRSHRLKITTIAAAVLFVLAAGVALMTTLNHHHSRPASAPIVLSTPDVHQARLVAVAGHHVDGEVFSHTGDQPWILMILRDTDTDSDMYICELDLTNGQHLTVGRFQLHKGTGGWGQSLDLHGHGIVTVRLREPDGTTRATATIT